MLWPLPTPPPPPFSSDFFLSRASLRSRASAPSKNELRQAYTSSRTFQHPSYRHSAPAQPPPPTRHLRLRPRRPALKNICSIKSTASGTYNSYRFFQNPYSHSACNGGGGAAQTPSPPGFVYSAQARFKKHRSSKKQNPYGPFLNPCYRHCINYLGLGMDALVVARNEAWTDAVGITHHYDDGCC